MLECFKGFSKDFLVVIVSVVGGVFTMAVAASETIDYEYDEAGRLIKVIRESDEKEIIYEYDDADNRKSKTVVTSPPPE